MGRKKMSENMASPKACERQGEDKEQMEKDRIILEKQRLRNRLNSRKKRARDQDKLCSLSAKKRNLMKQNERVSNENKKLREAIETLHNELPSLQHTEAYTNLQGSSKISAKARAMMGNSQSQGLGNNVFNFGIPIVGMPVQQSISQNPSFLPSCNPFDLSALMDARCGGCLSCSAVR